MESNSPTNNKLDLRAAWESNGTRRLDLMKEPDSDKGLTEFQKLDNKLARLEDLGFVLYQLYLLYMKRGPLYGDRYLAFVGNNVVREWPYKDQIFTSERAFKIIDSEDLYKDFLSKPRDVIQRKGSKTQAVSKLLHYEHWTPISFFRDIFEMDRDITEEAFTQALKRNYRIVWVTKEENKWLDSNSKSLRNTDAYLNVGIHIHEKDVWDYLNKS